MSQQAVTSSCSDFAQSVLTALSMFASFSFSVINFKRIILFY